MQCILSMLICVGAAKRRRKNGVKESGLISPFTKQTQDLVGTTGLSVASIAAAPARMEKKKNPLHLSLPTTDKKEVYKM